MTGLDVLETEERVQDDATMESAAAARELSEEELTTVAGGARAASGYMHAGH